MSFLQSNRALILQIHSCHHKPFKMLVTSIHVIFVVKLFELHEVVMHAESLESMKDA